ncbi:MAG: hypothetical protein HC860_10090 [Alkalinema sp. RU_4_3]|nr:hypothetical protein [Alkalinema sp. RU_4_3]
MRSIDKSLTPGQSYWLKLERQSALDPRFEGRSLRVLTEKERQPHQQALVLLEERSASEQDLAVKN